MSLLAVRRDLRAWLVREDAAAARRIGVKPAPGFRVYQNNYRAQLVACLEESFAHTRSWIGPAAFHEAIVTHIDRVPPNSWTPDAYGRDLPTTLAALYRNDPDVAELAWIEQALAEALVAPDADALTVADLPAIDWDLAILRFVPSLDVGDATTNAAAIWSALAEEIAAPAAALLPERGAILVWPLGLIRRFRWIDSREPRALLSARAALPFSQICETMVADLGGRGHRRRWDIARSVDPQRLDRSDVRRA